MQHATLQDQHSPFVSKRERLSVARRGVVYAVGDLGRHALRRGGTRDFADYCNDRGGAPQHSTHIV
jgi:hypothetical protein